VAGFLRNASKVQPLLIVLEDLHDADRGTLDLLLHLARNLTDARFMIVGTYRDVEVDRGHPLSGALAELRRSGSFLRVPLRGLTVDEVHRMYNAIRGQEVAWAQAEAVHRQTEGNPLFIQEVVRYIVEEGYVVREAGRWVLAEGTAPGTGLPEGLRDVIGKRLSRLSERTNQVLSVAAVIGREFRLDVLQRVVGAGHTLTEDELIGALEEAQERAVIEERSAVAGVPIFRFTHAFFRQTLYEEIFAARRIRWHQEVARALEHVHARRAEDHAAELAEHFAHSSDPGDLAKAVTYGELAAKRAMDVYAYAEAERHRQQALNAQDVLDPDDRARRCDLLLTLGEAMLPQEQPARIVSAVAEEAFALAEALADSFRACRAALLACDALIKAGRIETFLDWAERADRFAPPGTPQRVHADLFVGMGTMSAGRPAAAHVYLRRAVEGALELGDNSLVFASAAWALRNLNALRDQEMVEHLAQEIHGRARDGVRTGDLGMCLGYGGLVLLRCGDRVGAEALWREVPQLAERTRDTSANLMATGLPAYLLYIDGRLEEAVALSQSALAQGNELGLGGPVGWSPDAAALLFLLGRGSERELDRWIGPPRIIAANKALILAYLGRYEEARAIREGFGDIGSDDDETSYSILHNLFEAAILGGDTKTVRALARRLAPFAGQLCLAPAFGFGPSIARLLGDASILLGEPDESRAYYRQALDICARLRFRPEGALTRLHLAELLLDHYPDGRTEAQEHLDIAIAELREMKMQPALERALSHRGLLKA
jgi:tetratricopeptide (TPR) repeat protein